MRTPQDGHRKTVIAAMWRPGGSGVPSQARPDTSSIRIWTRDPPNHKSDMAVDRPWHGLACRGLGRASLDPWRRRLKGAAVRSLGGEEMTRKGGFPIAVITRTGNVCE
jgi:hypothetical protein